VRRTWWWVRFGKDGQGWDAFVHGGRRVKAVRRTAVRMNSVSPGWKLVFAKRMSGFREITGFRFDVEYMKLRTGLSEARPMERQP
jgi:hypothetical protein